MKYLWIYIKKVILFYQAKNMVVILLFIKVIQFIINSFIKNNKDDPYKEHAFAIIFLDKTI